MGLYTQGAWSGSTSNSAIPFGGLFSTTFTFAHAAISSGQFGEVLIASTTADVAPGDLVQVYLTPTIATVSQVGLRQSTTGSSRVTVILAVPGSSATSTFSGTGRITWIKLGA